MTRQRNRGLNGLVIRDVIPGNPGVPIRIGLRQGTCVERTE